MIHRIMKTALINDEIDITINSIEYVLKYATLMDQKKKSQYGRLLVKMKKQAEKLPKRIEVSHVSAE